jgi:hypothetical protein
METKIFYVWPSEESQDETISATELLETRELVAEMSRELTLFSKDFPKISRWSKCGTGE